MEPKLLRSVITDNIGVIPKNNLVAFNAKGEPLLFLDAQLNYDDLKILIDNNDGIISHISNVSMHWSPADRRDYTDYKEKVDLHIRDQIIHVTQADKTNWDSKETEDGAQLKVNVALELLNIHAADLDVHVKKIEKDRWNNTYTREEISNLLAKDKANTDWKDAVDFYEDLYTKYPDAKPGWICTVLYMHNSSGDVVDFNVTYIFAENIVDDDDGGKVKSMWIRAFSNSVPLATEKNNGQLSAADYVKLQNIEANANYYVHPDNINCRHVTDAEKKLWSNKASKDVVTIFSPGLMIPGDKEKIDTVEKYANFYEHPDSHPATIIEQTPEFRMVSDKQIAKWDDKPTGQLASEENDGQMSRQDFLKLFNIEEYANRYVHPLKHSSTDIAQDTLHRFVTDAQISSWDNKETKLESQYRADKALEYSKAYTDDVITKRLGLAPDVLDTFEELANALNNDPDFAANVAISLSNKADKTVFESHVRDYSTHLSASDRIKFDSVEANANFYTHPDYHPASMISTDPNNRFLTDVERAEWNSKANGNIATELLPGQMSPQMVQKLNAITTTGLIMSDWNETDPDSGSFIRNKPTAMPAHGGNSETVNSYTSNELINSRKNSTFVIGTVESGFTEKDVDFLCDGINDSAKISEAIQSVTEKGGSVFFREGVYSIAAEILIEKSNVVLKATGGVILEAKFLTNSSIVKITGDNCEIDGLSFKGNDSSTALSIEGNFNKVQHCSFTKNDGIVLTSCNYCEIHGNTFNVGNNAIMCTSSSADSHGNIITNNNIIQYEKDGIRLDSSISNVNTNNIVSSNIIQDCYVGIKITNILQSHNTKNNVISGNVIMRGTGLGSDYLYEQHTIRIIKGQFNVINSNICKGRAPVDNTSSENTHNIISENNVI